MTNESTNLYELWIQRSYPLLHNDTFLLACCAQGSRSLHFSQESVEFHRLQREALQQFEQLCARTLSTDESGAQARACLSYILLHNGAPAHRSIHQTLSDQAAVVVRNLMELQTYHSELLPAVTGVLAFANHSNPANRILLLTGIQQFFCVDDANVGDRQALATLLFAALNVELRRPLPEQSHEFQVRLIELVELHPHPASTALFAVVSDCHHDQHLRKVAQRANVRLMDTLGLMWRRTIVDQVSSSEFLSDHMQAIFDNSLSDLDKAQAIFNACKQKVSAKPSDLRLTLLKRCMSTSDSALLRIASSMAFWHMQSNGRISLPGSWRSAVESMEVCANS